MRDTPIFIFYSSNGAVPIAVQSMEGVVAFKMPSDWDVMERAFRRFAKDAIPSVSAQAVAPCRLLLRREFSSVTTDRRFGEG